MRKLVVLGGGYGGMRVIERVLGHQLQDISVTLVDRLPYHGLKTEYYALAAGTVSDRDIRIDFPDEIDYIYGQVTDIDTEDKMVLLASGEKVPYDDLVIGLGCEDKYHNVQGAAEFTYSIQTLEQSRKTQQAINGLRPGSVVSVVGAGLSGVELASELRESRPDLTVRLFDRGPSVLSFLSNRVSMYVQSWFEEHGVEVINNANITRVDADGLWNHEDLFPSDLTVWTAGIQPVAVVRNQGWELDGGGRVKLTEHHFVPGLPDVFVVGDNASLPYAPSGQLAEAQAEQIVQVLLCKWKGINYPELPDIKLKGTLGSLGKKAGFGVFMGKQSLTGKVARLLKSGILWKHKVIK
ncbi:NAD(P)/FAD-dependent oxidoreductase [Exiguobacterium sp. s131]|uniref:NAD(P)/FAD-dependent oxidoreductase n=1 Tax=Exiguobacterium sp. s131 TaxID=2751278 RepID=UPI001BE64BA6|nr:NAD(P)/FAD-dependent oxidoreductase [Exiguobacterium sp. s131]